MTRNILADVMVGLGIIILVIGILFVFDIWPAAGESNQQLKNAENNVVQNQNRQKNIEEKTEFIINKDYIEEKKMTNFNTDFSWERNLSSNTNQINFENKFAAENENKEEVEIVIPAGTSAAEFANKLSEKGIMDKERFIDTLIIFGAEKKLNSGTYVFEKDADLLEVFSKILVGGGDYSD